MCGLWRLYKQYPAHVAAAVYRGMPGDLRFLIQQGAIQIKNY